MIPSRIWRRRALYLALAGVGVGCAFLLYESPYFAWSSANVYSTLVFVVVVVAVTLAIALIRLLYVLFPDKANQITVFARRAFAAWVGFTIGLFGPIALGFTPVWLSVSEPESTPSLELPEPMANVSGRWLPSVAHAGGAYEGQTYTNSLSALESNLDFYQLFEIDFEWTSDGHLICLHDWEGAAERQFGPNTAGQLTFEQWSNYPRATTWKGCTWQELVGWLEANPQKSIVTDVKTSNLDALRLISSSLDSFRTQIIPQIYHPDEFRPVAALGFEKIIWTIYRFPGDDADVLEAASSLDVSAITIPKIRATQLGPHLAALGIDVYVHTVNEIADLAGYRAVGVKGIYTDFITTQPGRALG